MLALALTLSAGAGHAQDPPSDPAAAQARAKAHLERGRQAFQDGRYKDAVDAFLDAHREVPSAGLSFNAALAYEKLGDSAGALRFFREYLRQEPNSSDREKVQKRIGELESKLRERGVQQVTILSEPPGATVFIDTRPVGVTPWTGEILPGKHSLRLRREGYVDAQKGFELLPLRSMDVTATLEAAKETAAPTPTTAPTTAPPKPDRPPPPKKGVGIATWTAFGIGVAALGGAAVFEIMRGRAEEDVKTERTRVARLDANDRMEGHQTTARVLAGVGAAAVLTGGVLLYFDLSGSSGEEKPTGSLKPGMWLGCGAAHCGGNFGSTW